MSVYSSLNRDREFPEERFISTFNKLVAKPKGEATADLTRLVKMTMQHRKLPLSIDCMTEILARASAGRHRELDHDFGQRTSLKIANAFQLDSRAYRLRKGLGQSFCKSAFQIATSNLMLTSGMNAVAKKSGNSPGIDGVTYDAINGEGRIFHFIRAIHESLRVGKYKFQKLLKRKINKTKGGKREIVIPIFADRIVQRSIFQTIGPFLDSQFLPFSYGWRAKLGRQTALAQLFRHINEGDANYLILCDIKNAFPSTPRKDAWKSLESTCFTQTTFSS